jgi:hypothetical protein
VPALAAKPILPVVAYCEDEASKISDLEAAGYVRHFPGARHRFLIDHNPDVQMHVVPIPHVGSDVGSDTTRVWISKLEHLVRAMFCAPGRNRTYDLHICLSAVDAQSSVGSSQSLPVPPMSSLRGCGSVPAAC